MLPASCRPWQRPVPAASPDIGARTSQAERLEGMAAALAAVILLATLVSGLSTGAADPLASTHIEYEDQRAAQLERREAMANEVRYRGGETLIAAYGGAPYTYPSDVRIVRPGTDMTGHEIAWEGRPFDHPIYYGVRVARWMGNSPVGGMVDFTHSKVYSPLEEKARFTGTRNGEPVPEEAKIADFFHKLEFTHGHNMLTLNGLLRLPTPTAFLSPYVGIGLGISLPHTEVQLKGEFTRTYAYQYTGPAFQVLIGVEFRVPRLSYFAEYKFTAARYTAPLHAHDGGWVIGDLIYQFRRWLGGVVPEGGHATTDLVSHQVISGMGYRTLPATGAGPTGFTGR